MSAQRSSLLPRSRRPCAFSGAVLRLTCRRRILSACTNLASRWKEWLTPQDMQGFRPHVTVQNKVDPAQARALHSHLAQDFLPLPVTGEGLDLHRYRGGPWEAVRFFVFGG